METEFISASDGFAIAMLGMIFLSMAVIGLLLLCMRRSASKRDPHVDDLFEEMEEEARQAELARTRAQAEKKSDAPWEKDGDWWKK